MGSGSTPSARRSAPFSEPRRPLPWSPCLEPSDIARRDRRRRQLRLVLRPGALLLPGRDGERARAGADERRARRLSRRRHRGFRRLRRRRRQGRAGRCAGDLGRSRTTRRFSPPCRRRASSSGAARRSMGSASTGARRSRNPTSPRRTWPTCWSARGRMSWSPTCPSDRKRATEFYAERALQAGCAFVNCIPVFIASDPSWRRRFEERGLPIVGDDIKSQVGATIVHRVLDQPVPRARRAARPHLPAQFRRQHGFQEHARTGAAGVEEDLEDPRRDEPARRAPRSRERPCRPERPRALADRPEMGAYPDGGHHLRRRAPQPGAEAGGVGLAQLRRHRHRRGALRQARPRPGRRRGARRPVELLHEVAAAAVHGRGGAGALPPLRPRRAARRTGATH